MNKAILLGNLGADPVLHANDGRHVLSMRLATTEAYLDRSRVRQERTEWHNVVVFGKRAEALSKILRKGTSILVEGALRTSSYDHSDGSRRHKVEIVASDITLTGGR